MFKTNKSIIFAILSLLLILAGILIYVVSNDGVGSSSNMLKNIGIEDPVVNSMYDESGNSMGLKNKDNIESLQSTLDNPSVEETIDTIEGVPAEVTIALDEFKKLYNANDYLSLYELINQDYLKERNVSLLLNMFETEQNKFISVGYETSTLSFGKCELIANYYLCEVSFLCVDTNGKTQDSSNAIKATFTLYCENGTFTYLPFSTEDLFVLSDYGVSRIANVSAALNNIEE